jgi:hypothetical protein
MNKKYKKIGIFLIILMMSSVLLIDIIKTEKISIKNVELINSRYKEGKKESIPEKAIIIKERNSKKKEYGTVYLLEKGENTEIYIMFGYPVLAGEPNFTSIKKRDEKIIINTKNENAEGGLTQGSTFTYKIKINGKVEEVILKESNK